MQYGYWDLIVERLDIVPEVRQV